MERYFPAGIANGAAFLGREQETEHLSANMNTGRHSLLLAPRRYGKTSLVLHSLEKHKTPHVELDLFLLPDERAVVLRLLSGIEKLIEQVGGEPERWLRVLTSYFAKMKKKWTVSLKLVKLELTPEDLSDTPTTLLDAFNALEAVLTAADCQAVYFIDEFQEIAKLGSATAIEGAIRHFAQKTKHVTFIFSGSSRHLLMHIFGDSSRPLYELTDWLQLTRIPADTYQRYIHKVSAKTWQAPLAENAITKILELSACHPARTYALCEAIWKQYSGSKKTPTSKQVEKVWEELVAGKALQIRDRLAQLNSAQLKVLLLVATESAISPTGMQAQQQLALSGASITRNLDHLVKHEFIEKHAGTHHYHVLDPVMAAVLLHYYDRYIDL